MSKKAASPKTKRSSSLSNSSSNSLMEYLRHALDRPTLLQLYVVEQQQRGRFVCRAILQQLSGVAQQVVVRLACTGGQFPVKGVQLWIQQQEQQAKSRTSSSSSSSLLLLVDRVLLELYQWAILQEKITVANSTGAAVMVTMTNEFRKGLQAALCHLDASPWTALTPAQLQVMQQEADKSATTTTTTTTSEPVTPEYLERYTQSQWDAVMHFLVGTVGHREPPPAVVHFLLQTGLMQADPDFSGNEDDAPLVITQKGYDFMLQDNHQQVWHFVVQYLLSLESHKKGEGLRREALMLLICLSFARVGEAYLASSLNKDSRVMVKDLALFGLLYTRKIGKATVFYPTRVALQLVGNDGSDASSSAASALWSLSARALDSALANPQPRGSSHLAIIVQTNFQICAYTTSELHVSMLGLFCDIQTIRRLPNVVFLYMTRDSVKSAFGLGIQARQILRFLEKHAHPKLRTSTNINIGSAVNSPIPANVVDQVWLWDRERTRVSLTQVYQHQCLMEGEFQAVVQYTKHHGAHAWSSKRHRSILVDYQKVERVQKFVRQWRAKKAALLEQQQQQQQRG